MNQADVSKLISQLRIKVAPRHRNVRNPDGPEGRLGKLRKVVNGVVKHERIELHWNRADEARGYVERLIGDAVKYGETHKTTMEMADYWIEEKPLIHKLFKVLAPRFVNCNTSYTRLVKLSMHVGDRYPRAVLELRGHPYPPLSVDHAINKHLIHNVLLFEAKKEYRAKKYAEMAEKLKEEENRAEMAKAEPVETAQIIETTENTDTTTSETTDDLQAAATETSTADADSNPEPQEEQRAPSQEHPEPQEEQRAPSQEHPEAASLPESEKKK